MLVCARIISITRYSFVGLHRVNGPAIEMNGEYIDFDAMKPTVGTTMTEDVVKCMRIFVHRSHMSNLSLFNVPASAAAAVA